MFTLYAMRIQAYTVFISNQLCTVMWAHTHQLGMQLKVHSHITLTMLPGVQQVVLWDAACNFNAIILNQSNFNCLITS